MKRFLTLLAALIIPLAALAQAQITTKKIKISDFPEKTTKVVLTGNALYDAVLKNEIAARWRIAPYEFCTLQEFNSLKGKDNYYFLITTKGQYKTESEPGLQFLTLVKGGKAAEGGIDEMLEIVSLPIASAEDPSGRELTFLPAFITILQQYTQDSIAHDINAYVGLTNYTKHLSKTKGMTILMAEEDLDPKMSQQAKDTYLPCDFKVTDIDTADKMMSTAAPNTLVSYVAAPADAKNGSYCYKMLIDTQTHRIYYFKKHRINSKYGAGFADYDLRSIAMTRKENIRK
jgi:hypothetical protein